MIDPTLADTLTIIFAALTVIALGLHLRLTDRLHQSRTVTMLLIYGAAARERAGAPLSEGEWRELHIAMIRQVERWPPEGLPPGSYSISVEPIPEEEA